MAATIVFEGCTFDIKDYIGVSLKTNLSAGKKQHQVATSQEQLTKIGRAVLRRIKKDPGFVEQHTKDCYEACENLVNTAKAASRGNLKKLSDEDLLKRFQWFAKALRYFAVFLYIPHGIEEVIGKKVEELFSKRNFKNVSLADLLIPSQYPESTLEQHELIALASAVEEGSVKDYKNKLYEHSRKYSWLTTYEMDGKPASLSHFSERFKELLKTDLKGRISEIESNRREIEKVDRFIKKNLEGELLHLLSILRGYIYLRSYRAEMWAKAHVDLQPLLKEVARRGRLSLTQLCFLTEMEVDDFLTRQRLPPKREIDGRIQAYAYLGVEGEYKLFSGPKEVNEVIAQEFGDFDVSGVREFKGTVANRGYGKGKARVILDVNKVGTLKKGEILVAIMTRPEYVVAMEKCAAIVTDEGGVLCHAAIVSREMDIPCVIGTKIATKVLKDGDLVEVDADPSTASGTGQGEGIVRKLS